MADFTHGSASIPVDAPVFKTGAAPFAPFSFASPERVMCSLRRCEQAIDGIADGLA